MGLWERKAKAGGAGLTSRGGSSELRPDYPAVLAQLTIRLPVRTQHPGCSPTHCSRARPITSADTTKFVPTARSSPPITGGRASAGRRPR